MCGIAGMIRFDGAPAETGVLRRMLPFIERRGPDAEGIWTDGPVGFAHRRLSIIDLSEGGRQPMTDASGTVTICYNGEIYNYAALRRYLETVGLSSSTDSDTEMLLNGYRRWGIEKLLEKIDGMFAFVIYDKRRQLVFIARDRFGEKPLYYRADQNGLSFSSDIRALHATAPSLSFNAPALDYYLSELSVPQPLSIWNEISQLPPAHFMTLDLRRGNFKTESYWKLNFSSQEISEADALATTEQKLRDAVLSRTVADVPVACLLSSGADSGLITALLAQEAGTVNTFSAGFAWKEMNELPEAKQLAQRYKTNHTEVYIEPDVRDLVMELPEIFGEPYADSSAIPSLLIYREIRKQYKVALGGDGGDELFGGYFEYPLLWKAEQHARQHPPGTTATKLKRLANAAAWKAGWAEENTGNLETYFAIPHHRKLFRQMGFDEAEKKSLFDPSFHGANGYTENYFLDTWNAHAQRDVTTSFFAASLHTRLLNDYLVKVDRCAMHYGLEVRSPFLDPALAAFAAQLPNELKLKGGVAKYLLKQLAVKHIDKNFLQRPKRGFGIPVGQWLRGELSDLLKDVLFSNNARQRGIFNQQFVQRIIEEHQSEKRDHTHQLWALLCFELWMQRYQP